MRLYVCTKGCAVHWCRCFCCNFAGITQAACFSLHTWMVDVFLYLCCHPRYCCCYCRCLIHLFVRPSIGVAEWQESCCWPIAVGNRGYKPISCLWCNRTPVILHTLASYCSCLCPQWMVASETNISVSVVVLLLFEFEFVLLLLPLLAHWFLVTRLCRLVAYWWCFG